MKKKQVLFTLLTAMALASCSNESTDSITTDGSIRVHASMNALTRVLGTAFENEDKISVYAYETGEPTKLIVDNVINTFNGAVWTPETPMAWKDKTTEHDFFAIYPARDIDFATAETITLTDDIVANDILMAQTKNVIATTTKGAVSLAFSHMMARVSVTLTFNDEFDAEPTVSSVALHCKKSVEMDYAQKTYLTVGDRSDMTFTKENTNAYVGVTAAQELEGAGTIKVYLDGDVVPYTYTPAAAIPMVEGHHYQFNLKVGGSKKIELAGMTITDWTTGTAIEGGAIK